MILAACINASQFLGMFIFLGLSALMVTAVVVFGLVKLVKRIRRTL